MNSVNLIGRLTADPEIHSTSEGRSISKFSIAVDRVMTQDKKVQRESEGKQTADFPRVIAWGRLAETANTYLKKGSQVGIVGQVTTGFYTKDDGSRVYTTDITANQIRFIKNPERELDARSEEMEDSHADERVPF